MFGEGSGVLIYVAREGSPEMALEQEAEREEVSYAGARGKSVPADGTESAKALRQLSPWFIMIGLAL